jgi:hypothetical protein
MAALPRRFGLYAVLAVPIVVIALGAGDGLALASPFSSSPSEGSAIQ